MPGGLTRNHGFDARPPRGRRGARSGGGAAPRRETVIRPSFGSWRTPPFLAAASVGDVLEGIWADVCRMAGAGVGGEDEAAAREAMERNWTAIVGGRLARHTRPGPSVGDGRVLRVWVAHPLVLAEARQTLRDLAERIRRRVPAARWEAVEFRLSDEAGLAPPG